MANATNALSDFAAAVAAALALAAPAWSQDQKERAPLPQTSATRTVEIGTLDLTIPATWQERQPRARMRHTQFSYHLRHTPSDAVKFFAEIPAVGELPRGRRAELAVFHLGPHGAGSARKVVGGWSRQFARSGQYRVARDPKVEIYAGKRKEETYTLVDACGTYIYDMGPIFRFEARLMPGVRMLAAVLTAPEGPYYVKLTGPEPIVAAAEGEFRGLFGGVAADEIRLDAALRARPAVVRVRFELDGRSYSAAGARLTLGSAETVCTGEGGVFEDVEPGKHELRVERVEGCKPVTARELQVVRGRTVEVVILLERLRPRASAPLSPDPVCSRAP